jgi:hypothetical protein
MTTTNPTDPNQVRLTGENSFIRLLPRENSPQTTRVSHWRVLLSPGGPGHVLFLKSDVTDNEVLVYSDNIALARWLQEEIESLLFPEFADQSLPVVEAIFSRSGDVNSYWTETVESDEDTVSLTWYDFGEPFMLRVPAGSVPGRPHGVYSCFVPARKAQVTVNGVVAQGRPFPDMRGDKVSSTACLAWSETWVRP